MNIQKWVRQQIENLGLIRNREVLDLSRLGNEFPFGSFRHQGEVEALADWQIVDTEGDGSCLIHSFLQLLSPEYRTLSKKDKRTMARILRTQLAAEMSDLSDREREEMFDMKIYLDDGVGSKIAKYFGYGLLLLVQATDERDTPFARISIVPFGLSPLLIILNSGASISDMACGNQGHYEAVMRRGEFVAPAELANELASLAERLNNLIISNSVRARIRACRRHEDDVKADAPVKPLAPIKPSRSEVRLRCDTPRVLQFPNSLSLDAAKELARAYQIPFTSKDDKKSICKKLKAKAETNVDWFDHGKLQGRKRRTKRKSNRKSMRRSAKR